MTALHPDPAARLRRQCADLVQAIETVFEPAALAIFEQQAQVHEVETLMARLAQAVGDEGRRRLEQAVSAAGRHLATIGDQFGFLERVAVRLTATARDIRSLSQQQHQNMLMASMVATNAKVVSDQLEDQAKSLSGFAARVKRVITEAQDTAATVSGDLVRADQELGRVAAGIARMTEAAARLNAQRAALPPLLDGLAAFPDLQRAVARSRGACARLDGALQSAVMKLQCGDAVRQRLEHVIAILDHADMRHADRRGPLLALAFVQSQAALDTVTEALSGAQPDLAEIDRAAKAARVEMRSLTAMREAEVLESIARLARRMAEGLARLDAIRQEITPAMEQLSEAYAAAAHSTKAIAGLEGRMHLLGVNAMLVSSKIGTEGEAMTEVAKHLRDCTGAIGRDSAQIVRAAQLQELNAILFSAPTAPATDAQTLAMLDRLGQDCAEISEAVAGFAGKAAGGRVGLLGAIGQHLADFTEQADRLRRPLATLPQMAEPSPELAATLAAIRALYTMEAERSLHDRLFGASSDTVPEKPSEPQEDLAADVFF